jgi:hypothetical protein
VWPLVSPVMLDYDLREYSSRITKINDQFSDLIGIVRIFRV